ncbi:MAG: S49 family peptidase, partial [Planctomycetota bacterium]
ELDTEKIKEFSDGRVFSGSQAKEKNLVDELGYVSDAIALVRQKSGSQRVRVIMYHRPLGYRANVYSTAPSPQANTQVNLLNVSAPHLLPGVQPRFLYLWTGHTFGR